MPAVPISKEQLQAVQDRQREERLAKQANAPVPQVINTDTVASLHQSDVLEYRGRTYLVPPVAYFDGADCQRLNLRIATLSRSLRLLTGQMAHLAEQDVSEENQAVLQHLLTRYEHDIGAMVGMCEQAVAKMKRLVRPMGWWDRVTWPWRQPFLRADDSEITELLGFFSTRRTSRPVRHPRDRATTIRTKSPQP